MNQSGECCVRLFERVHTCMHACTSHTRTSLRWTPTQSHYGTFGRHADYYTLPFEICVSLHKEDDDMDQRSEQFAMHARRASLIPVAITPRVAERAKNRSVCWCPHTHSMLHIDACAMPLLVFCVGNKKLSKTRRPASIILSINYAVQHHIQSMRGIHVTEFSWFL